jgi:choline dehydrogenase-like flavoprotein
MLIDFRDNPALPETDICVVGGGPIGIAIALACEAHGLSVLLIESGRREVDLAANRLSRADIVDHRRHAAMSVAVRRGLGGTSRWWGGRCVPYDDFDFIPRSNARDAEWPICHNEIRAWYKAAAEFLGCGQEFILNPSPPWRYLDRIAFDSIERWLPQVDMARRHGKRLKHSRLITCVLGATVTELQFSLNHAWIEAITVADSTRRTRLPVKRCVLSCGGLETTRLLLASSLAKTTTQRAGALGRYYMGHISGKIANIVLANPKTISDHDFFLEGGNFVRRRFTIRPDILAAEQLTNIAFWIDNPPFHDPAHKSGILSLVWFALSVPPLGRRFLPEAIRLIHVGRRPYRYLAHLRNLLRAPIATVVRAMQIIYGKFLQSPERPGFLVRNPAGCYALHYLAEHLPNAHSRVSLSNKFDELGVPRLLIDLKFDEKDARAVMGAHVLLDRALRKAGVARLEYYATEDQRLTSVLDQATDGFHQIGTTRMGVSPDNSVVDQNCRVHGVENLFIASTSVLPTSGHAPPTFLSMALAMRLAAYLSKDRDQRQRSANTTGAKEAAGADGL